MPRDIQERTFVFAAKTLIACDGLIRRGGVSALIGRQLAKAASSAGANLEEATAGQTKPDFITKTSVALKETRESRYWLRLTEAVPPARIAAGTELRQEANELVSILTSIVKKAKSSSRRG